MFVFLLSLITLSIAAVAAFYSIYGLSALFVGATIPIIIMGSVLEAGKLIAVSYLYRYWHITHILLRGYLSIAVFVLMIITSTGIYGFLSHSYSSEKTDINQSKVELELIKEKLIPIQQELDNIQNDIDRIPDNYITKRQEMIEFYAPRKSELEADRELYKDKKQKISLKIVHEEALIGPIKFIAETLELEINKAINYVMLLIVFVFDPLAVALTLCVNVIVVNKSKRKVIDIPPKKDGEHISNEKEMITEPLEYKDDIILDNPINHNKKPTSPISDTESVGDPHQDENHSHSTIPHGNTTKPVE